MAKQVGDIILEGTIDDLTFYKMEGKGYARRKTSLTGKRVKKDPRFARTMQSAHRLGRGSQLAAKVYRALPRAKQVYALYKELKSMAVMALKEGRTEMEVVALLSVRILRNGAATVNTEKKKLSVGNKEKKRGTEMKLSYYKKRVRRLFSLQAYVDHRSRQRLVPT